MIISGRAGGHPTRVPTDNFKWLADETRAGRAVSAVQLLTRRDRPFTQAWLGKGVVASQELVEAYHRMEDDFRQFGGPDKVFDWLHFFTGANLVSALVPWVGSGTVVNNGPFVAGDYGVGLKGGPGKGLQFPLNINTRNHASGGAMMMFSEQPRAGNTTLLGTNLADGFFHLVSTPSAYVGRIQGTLTGTPFATTAVTSGILFSSTTAANDLRLFLNGTQVAINTDARAPITASALPQVFVMPGFITSTMRGFGYGVLRAGLTPAQVATVTNIFARFMWNAGLPVLVLPAGHGLHPDTVDFHQRVIAAGGTVDRTELLAHDFYVRAIYGTTVDNSTLRARLGRANMFTMRTGILSAWVPWLRGYTLNSPVGGLLDIGNGFTTVNATQAGGLDIRASTRYVDTQASPAQLGMTLNGTGFGVWARNPRSAGLGGRTDIGTQASNTSRRFFISSNTTSGDRLFCVVGNTNSANADPIPAPESGNRISVSRLSPTDLRGYANGVQVASSSAATTMDEPDNTFPFFVGAQNNGGVLDSTSARHIGYYWLGIGFTEAQEQAHDLILAQTMQKLGRI